MFYISLFGRHVTASGQVSNTSWKAPAVQRMSRAILKSESIGRAIEISGARFRFHRASNRERAAPAVLKCSIFFIYFSVKVVFSTAASIWWPCCRRTSHPLNWTCCGYAWDITESVRGPQQFLTASRWPYKTCTLLCLNPVKAFPYVDWSLCGWPVLIVCRGRGVRNKGLR